MKYLTIIIIILLIIPFGGITWINNNLQPVCKNTSLEKEISVSIPKGASVSKIGILLEQKNIIKSSFFFEYYIRYLGCSKELKYGNYNFKNSFTLDEIIKILKHGEQSVIPLKIISGETLDVVSKKISRLKFIKKTKKEVYSFIKSCNVRINKKYYIIGIDPFIRPDTYFLNPEMKLKDIVNFITKERIDLVSRFIDKYNNKAKNKLTNKKLFNILVLSSIIEKEGRSKDEKLLISSVFINRLNKKIKLESCATINYILRKNGINRSRLLYSDLKLKSPYNTYLNYGLPPDLICIPSDDSIEAAFFPKKTEYLYFVLQSGGKHHFSKSLREHNKYKSIYKRLRKNK